MFSLGYKIHSAHTLYVRFMFGMMLLALLILTTTSHSIAQTSGPMGDYGDAPENIEARYENFDPDLIAAFPAEFESQDDSSFIVHLFPTEGPLLGLDVTTETNAQTVDEDEDDAWEPFSFVACQTSTIVMDISLPTSSVGNEAYLNVLADFNHDGTWNGAEACTQDGDVGQRPIEVDEWVIQNLALHEEPFNLEPGFAGTIEIPDVLAGPSDGEMWMRFTVSGEPINELVHVPVSQGGEGWNGEGLFLNGETEDYFSCVLATERDFFPHCPSAGAGADLQLEVTSPERAVAGEPFELNIMASNLGPDPATGVSFTLPLFEGLELLDARLLGASCDESVLCDLGDILAGESVGGTISLLPDALLSGDELVLEGLLSSESDDPNPDDNAITFSIPLARESSLSVGVTPDRDTVVPGEDLGMIIDIINNGPSAARNVTLNIPIGDGLNLLSTIPSVGECDLSVTCVIDTILPGESETVDLSGLVEDVPVGDVLSLPISVVSDSIDPDSADNALGLALPVVSETLGGEGSNLLLDLPSELLSAEPGDVVDFAIGVLNEGPEDAENVVLTDILPAALNLLSVTPSQGECDDRIVCFLGPIEAGESAVVDIVSEVDPEFTGTLLNTVSVLANAVDPVPDDNMGVIEIGVVETLLETIEGDLILDKSTDSTGILPGDLVSWTLTVENDSPVAVDDVVLSDVLPIDVALQQVTSSHGTCDLTVRCELGTLSSGEIATVDVTGLLNLGFVGDVLSNTASVDSGSEALIDLNLENNTDTSTINVGLLGDAEIDLGLNKSSAQSSILPGDEVSWTIVVENLGVDVAEDVNVTDLLPAGVTLLDVTSTQGTCDLTISCDIGALAAGESATINIDGLLGLGFVGNILSNTANASSSSGVDINIENNSNVVTINVGSLSVELNPDLSLLKEVSPGTAVAGETVTWTLTVVNNGDGDANGVQLSDILPNGVTLLDTVTSQGSCSGVITCNLGVLASGESAVVTITGLLDSGYSGGPLLNNADVSNTSGELDIDLSNNTDSVSVPVSLVADLLVDLTGPDSVVGGETGMWTFNILNSGPSDALNVNLTDNLPAGLTLLDVTSSQGSCTSTVTCSLGTITVGEGATVTLTGLVDSGFLSSNMTNSVSVSSVGSTDPDTANNSGSLLSLVDLESDLLVDSFSNIGSVIAGEPINITTSVTNNGPSDALNVTLSDIAPVGLEVLDVSTDTGSCTTAVTCTLGTLAPR